jgi:hypothetical protein
MYIYNAPPGWKKNFRGALLVNFRSDGNCTSVSGTPEVHWTSGAEFLKVSSLFGPFLILIIWLAVYFQFCTFFCTSGVPCCSSVSSLILLYVNKLQKFILFQRRNRKILNQFPSTSFSLIYMSEGLKGTHLWWHCPFKESLNIIWSIFFGSLKFFEFVGIPTVRSKTKYPSKKYN